MLTANVSCGVRNSLRFQNASILTSVSSKRNLHFCSKTRQTRIRNVSDTDGVTVTKQITSNEETSPVLIPPVVQDGFSFTASLGVFTLISLCSTSEAMGAESMESTSSPLLPGIGIIEGTILLAPVLLYAIFTIYRTGFNRNAKASDFLLLVVSIFIFGNILSTIFLKVRLF
eukprot:g7121.t1